MGNYPAIEAIQTAIKTLSKGVSETGSDTWESETISSYLLGILDDLETAKERIEYLSRPSREGSMYQNDRGRFVVTFFDGDTGPELTCGSPLEALYAEEWHIGRVEHKSAGYYFYGSGNPLLMDIEKVRVRG